MNRARKLALDTGANALLLETTIDTINAQRLCERLDYKRDTPFYRYALGI